MKRPAPDTAADAGSYDAGPTRLVIGTREGGDPLVDPTVTSLLALIKEHLDMDVVFVSPYVDDAPAFERYGQSPGLRFDPARALQRCAFPVDTCASAPITLSSGTFYGMLCSLAFTPSHSPDAGQRHLSRLQMAARLAARLIDGDARPPA